MNRTAAILARQTADVLAGCDPSCTIERLREIRGELMRAGKSFPRIKKLSCYTRAWYYKHPEILVEVLS